MNSPWITDSSAIILNIPTYTVITFSGTTKFIVSFTVSHVSCRIICFTSYRIVAVNSVRKSFITLCATNFTYRWITIPIIIISLAVLYLKGPCSFNLLTNKVLFTINLATFFCFVAVLTAWTSSINSITLTKVTFAVSNRAFFTFEYVCSSNFDENSDRIFARLAWFSSSSTFFTKFTDTNLSSYQ